MKVDEDKIGKSSFAFEIPVLRKPVAGVYVDELTDEGKIRTNYYVVLEVDKYTKFYSSPQNRKIRNALSIRAKEMLLWIMDEVIEGKDYVCIPRKRYMEEMGITSLNTYKEAIKNLERNMFIAYTKQKDVFFINATFFYKGSRPKKYPDKVIRTKWSKE